MNEELDKNKTAQEEKETIEKIDILTNEDEKRNPNVTLREILGGDFLTAQAIRRQIWLVVLIVFFTILYVGNRYGSQKELIEINKLSEDLKDAKYKALSSSSTLTERCRESHVLEILRNNKDSVLHIADQPPYIIKTPEE
jgi:hypothetical protein